MTSFSTQFPKAFHVLPLHALKGILAARALLTTGDGVIPRPTSAGVDEALGFCGMTHLYLAASDAALTQLPILQAQLQASALPPYPHAVLTLRTELLRDEECVVCNWNIAVSRPAVPGLCKGGNWTRGTAPHQILAAWAAYQQTKPRPERARGYFNAPYKLPTLVGGQLRHRPDLLNSGPRGLPELLVTAPVGLERFGALVLFSVEDRLTVDKLPVLAIPIRVESFPTYAGSAVPRRTRELIDGYFAGDGLTPPEELSFDRLRPVA